VPDCRWDLIVCDEAHKMSATYFGGEIKYTKRYRLGELLSTITRHFLLMTATPLRGEIPRWRASGGHVRPYAPDGQGEPA
jgi:hypothetical protein